MLLLLLLLTVYSANAQRYVQYALNTAQVFSYVEQMPTLPGREGPTTVQAALQKLITNPKRADNGEGQVSFVVEPDGRVTCRVMLRSVSSTMDKAVPTTTLRLPRFEPGHHNDQPVAVRLVVPVVINVR